MANNCYTDVKLVFVNNESGGVSVSISSDQRTAVLTKSYTTVSWAPIAIKDPGSETASA